MELPTGGGCARIIRTAWQTPGGTTEHMADTIGQERRARPVAHRRDTTYQFPVYRWLSWLVVAGYLAGLGVMCLVAGMFGIPAPLGWAFVVIVCLAGIALLDRPRAMMNAMMFYILLMPSNRLLGLVGLPLPGFIDELLFLPPIAVIVMNLVQGRMVKGGNWFPVLFGMVTALSWYVNGKQGLPVTVKILLVNLKFFIIWYFCRLTLSFKNTKELFRWCWLFIGFAAIQFAYNTLWHQAPWPRYHPDRSGGVFGPDSMCAHYVGYLSSIALFLLAGWVATRWNKLTLRRKWGVLFVGLVVLYDLVFMTDTKHVLFLIPLACGGLLFLPGIPAKFKWSMGSCAVVVVMASVVYLHTQNLKGYMPVLHNFGSMPKGQLFKAVTVDFPHLVRYPVLGAGPGRFASDAAREARAPLARIYITPYYDEALRLGYFGRRGTTSISSVAGSVNTDFFYIVSEFGWLGEIVYAAFWVYCAFSLYRKGIQAREARSEAWGVCWALAVSLVLFMMLQLLTSVCTMPCLAFPVWMMVGRVWDMPVAGPEDEKKLLSEGAQEDGEFGFALPDA